MNRRAACPWDVFRDETRNLQRRTTADNYKGAINEPGNSQGEFVGRFMGQVMGQVMDNSRDARGARRLLASPW